MKALTLVFLILLSLQASAATISGTAFEWFTLEAREDIILEINTVPKQTLVSGSGDYSFTVNDGNYTLKAYYFEENILRYYAEEEILVLEDGNFNFALIMFPPLEGNDFLLEDFTELNDLPELEEETKPTDFDSAIAGIILAAIAFALIFFGARKITKAVTGIDSKMITVEEKIEMEKEFFSGKSEQKENEISAKNETSEKNKIQNEMNSELSETLEILKRYGGRMTQKELREKLPFGEAKTSLIVAELEEMGKVKKFKKGRGNIIVLKN